MYVKYKDASKVVDQIKQNKTLPTKQQVEKDLEIRSILENARWVRQYLEAIRVEKVGRDIHSRRFFLKGRITLEYLLVT